MDSRCGRRAGGKDRGLWRFSERLKIDWRDLWRLNSRSLWEWTRFASVWERTGTPCRLTGLLGLVVRPLSMCCWNRFFFISVKIGKRKETITFLFSFNVSLVDKWFLAATINFPCASSQLTAHTHICLLHTCVSLVINITYAWLNKSSYITIIYATLMVVWWYAHSLSNPS